METKDTWASFHCVRLQRSYLWNGVRLVTHLHFGGPGVPRWRHLHLCNTLRFLSLVFQPGKRRLFADVCHIISEIIHNTGVEGELEPGLSSLKRTGCAWCFLGRGKGKNRGASSGLSSVAPRFFFFSPGPFWCDWSSNRAGNANNPSSEDVQWRDRWDGRRKLARLATLKAEFEREMSGDWVKLSEGGLQSLLGSPDIPEWRDVSFINGVLHGVLFRLWARSIVPQERSCFTDYRLQGGGSSPFNLILGPFLPPHVSYWLAFAGRSLTSWKSGWLERRKIYV